MKRIAAGTAESGPNHVDNLDRKFFEELTEPGEILQISQSTKHRRAPKDQTIRSKSGKRTIVTFGTRLQCSNG